MASNLSTIEFICDQINKAGTVTYKKMFGEYLIYCNAKPIFLVCDDTLFVKMLESIVEYVNVDNVGYPYQGAKLHYIISELDNKQLLTSLAIAIEKVTPLPKPKKNKVAKNLSDLPNIGEELTKQLQEININTIAELIKVGSKQAWLKIKTNDPSSCYNKLCALEGAIQDIRWHNLSKEVKEDLKAFYLKNN